MDIKNVPNNVYKRAGKSIVLIHGVVERMRMNKEFPHAITMTEGMLYSPDNLW